MANTILIVDDDPTQRRLMRAVCERGGFPVLQADSGENALSLLHSPQGRDVGLMMLDLRMPGLGGMETLKRAKSFREELPVIVLTAQGGIDTVVEAMQSGAADFFVKPASPERVMVSINNALNITTLKGEVSRLKRKADGAMGFKDLVGDSAALAHVMRLGERAAASNIPILITGESGAGKKSSPAPFKARPNAQAVRSLPSIAAPFRKTSSKAFSSAMKRALSPARTQNTSESSRKLTAARYSLTKSASFRSICR